MGERKRPGRLRRWVVRPMVWGAAGLLLLLAFAAWYVNTAAMAERLRVFVVARASEALGRPVEIGQVSVDLWPPGIEARNVVLPGPFPGDRPVAEVPALRLDASLTGFREPVLRLRRLWLDRPRFYLEVAADGSLNLPLPESSGQGGGNLQVVIGDLIVEDGRFDLNEVSVPVSLTARGVLASVHGTRSGREEGPGTDGIEGRVEVAEVALTLPKGRAYPLTFEAFLDIDPGVVAFRDARLSGPNLEATSAGAYTFRSGEKLLTVEVQARGDAAVLTDLGYLAPGELTGPFDFTGALDWNAGEWLLAGNLGSERLVAPPREILGVAAGVRGTKDSIELDLLSASYAGGRLSGPISIGLSGGSTSASSTPVGLALEARGLSAGRIFADLGLDLPMLASDVSGRVTYRFEAEEPLEGSGSADLLVSAAGGDSPTTLPLSGPAHLEVSSGNLSGTGIRLSAPGQEVTISDLAVDLSTGDGGFAFDVTSLDIGRLGPLLPVSKPGEPPELWLPTAGNGRLFGDLSFGKAGGVAATIQLDLDRLVAPGGRADHLNGTIQLTERAVENLDLVLSRGAAGTLVRGAASLTLQGRVPFEEPDDPLALAIEARGWPLEEVKPFVPVDLPLSGPVTGTLSLTGTADALSGEITASLQPAEVAGFAADELAVEMRFGPEVVDFEAARLTFPAGVVRGAGRIGLGPGQPMDITLESPALALDQEPFFSLLGGRLSGTGVLAGRFEGTLDEPRAALTFEVPQLDAEAHAFGTAAVDARWENGRLTASAHLADLLTVEGGGVLDAERADMKFAVRAGDLSTLLLAFAGQPLPGLEGRFAGEVTVAGSLSNPDVRVVLPEVQATVSGLALSNLEPVEARITSREIEIRSFYLGNREAGTSTEGSEVFVGGTIGLGDEGEAAGALDLNVQGSLPAKWLEPFLPDVRLAGTLNALGSIGGTVSAPRLDGQADFADGRVIVSGFPHALDDLEAVVFVYPDRLVIDTVTGRLAGGTLRASGDVGLGAKPFEDYELQARIDNVRLRYPEGWTVEADALLTLEPTPGGQIIQGTVNLERAAYLEDLKLSLFELLAGFLRRQRVEVALADSALSAIELNINVSGPGALEINNNVADLDGSVALDVRGTLARPVPVGQVELDPGGQLVYGENEYEVERGLLTFSSLDRIDPEIYLVASSRVREYQITLNLTGTLEKLNATFASDPPLPNLDVIALLTTGEQLQSEAAGASTGVGPGGAEAFLYNQLGSALSGRVKSLFRFDKFRIDPLAASGGSVDSARVLVGKQISRDLFVTYQTGLSSNDEYLVQAEWRVAPGLTVVLSARQGQQADDHFAVDLRWEKRF